MSAVPDIFVRKAEPEDAAACAAINLLGWRTAYEGLIDGEMLDNMSMNELLKKWDRRLNNPDPEVFCYVAVVKLKNGKEEIAGYVLGGKNRNAAMPFTHEVMALYLHPPYKRQGIGRLLFRAAIEEFKRRGVLSMLVFVLEGNVPARKFYESFRPVFSRDTTINIGNRTYNETALGWPDITGI
jgi:ribosomal protein S18 acetylase RimI-like enzyme